MLAKTQAACPSGPIYQHTIYIYIYIYIYIHIHMLKHVLTLEISENRRPSRGTPETTGSFRHADFELIVYRAAYGIAYGGRFHCLWSCLQEATYIAYTAYRNKPAYAGLFERRIFLNSSRGTFRNPLEASKQQLQTSF